MAVDNPTYFAVTGGERSPGPTTTTTTTTTATATVQPRGLTSFFRRRVETGNDTKTSASVSRTETEVLADSRDESVTDGCCVQQNAANVKSVQSHEENESNRKESRTGFGRRSFRNLFRSVSANSEVEKARDFLNGDPRPSDVAPPSPYLPHRSHSHSENDDRRRPVRKKVLKSASELLSNDMVYCGLSADDAASQGLTTDRDDAEIFLGVDDARYYNVSATLPIPGSAAAGRRRHSIGTFLAKSNGKSTIDCPRQPSTVAPPIPTADNQNDVEKSRRSKASRRRRRRGASSGRGTRTATDTSPSGSSDTHTDDIVFISSKDSSSATQWVSYFVARFQEIGAQKQYKQPFRIKEVAIEDAAGDSKLEDEIGAARLQIIVVSPSLLDFVDVQPEQAACISRQLSPEKVIAIMLGVDEVELTDSRSAALVSNSDWLKFTVGDENHEFVNEILRTAINILASPKMHFSIIPKKVKVEQNKVIALLIEPLTANDVVTVVVEKLGEANVIHNVKRRNPYTLQFSVPEKCLEVSIIVNVRITKNGQSLGVQKLKCESRIRELDQILRAYDHPLEFMRQTLGFSSIDRDQLDTWMVQNFQRNLPPHFNLLAAPLNDASLTNKNQKISEEYPTLLHFAARFGFEKLAIQLLECPGGSAACEIKNANDRTPAEIADHAGHSYLAHTLRGYMQMNEFTNVYTYLRDMNEANTTPPPTPGSIASGNESESEYRRPRSLNDTYLVPPIPRPLASVPQRSPMLSTSPATSTATITDYSPVPTPMPITAVTPPLNQSSSISNGSDPSLQGYMKMYSSVSKSPGTPVMNRPYQIPSNNSARYEESKDNIRSDAVPTNGSIKRNQNGKIRSGQDELLELLHDFKNNVHTLPQLEVLVEDWKNRHDVQEDFEEKRKDVMLMREQYEKMQKLMKTEAKKGSPLDLFRRVFNKSKNKEMKDPANTEEESSAGSKLEVPAIHRPFSSLSASSSLSSGRTSIASVCSGTSFGDSGTHSDPEERKHSVAENGEIPCYAVPPLARPFPSKFPPARVKPASPPNNSSHNTLEARPPQPAPRPPESPTESPYYIDCTSSLPIHAFKSDGTPREAYSSREPYPPRDVRTPSSPSEQADYIEILDDEESSGKNVRSYSNIDPAPPGMCIPVEYTTAVPSVTTFVSVEVHDDDGIPKTDTNDDFRPSSAEYVESDTMNEFVLEQTGEMEPPTHFPDYANVVISSPEEEIATYVPKHKVLPAPPIPPRKKT